MGVGARMLRHECRLKQCVSNILRLVSHVLHLSAGTLPVSNDEGQPPKMGSDTNY